MNGLQSALFSFQEITCCIYYNPGYKILKFKASAILHHCQIATCHRPWVGPETEMLLRCNMQSQALWRDSSRRRLRLSESAQVRNV